MATVRKSGIRALVIAALVAAGGGSVFAQDQADASGPMRIAVLVDTSQVMEPHINDMRNALRGFFRELQGSADIALYEVGERPLRLVDYTRDPVRLNRAVGRLFARPGSGSYLLDAIVEASRELALKESGRTAIVVISGQGPEFSNRQHDNVLKELRGSRATLDSIVVTRRGLPILRDDVRERELTLSEGADATGGRRRDLLTSMALAEALTDLARELKTQNRVRTEQAW